MKILFLLCLPSPKKKTEIPVLNTISVKLKISAADFDPGWPVKIINAGLTTLIVPIRTLECLLNISPDFTELKEFCLASAVDIIEVFSSEVAR